MTIHQALRKLHQGCELVVERQSAFVAPVGRHYLRKPVDPEGARRLLHRLSEYFHTRDAPGRRVLTPELRDGWSLQEVASLFGPSKDRSAGSLGAGPDDEDAAPIDSGAPLVLDQRYYSVKELADLIGRVAGSLKKELEGRACENGGSYDLAFGREKSCSTGYRCTVVYRSDALVYLLREVYDVPAALPSC